MQSSSEVLKHVGGFENNNLDAILKHLDQNEEQEHSYPHSYYLDIEEFSSKIQTNETTFPILSLNIECLSAKFDNLCAFLHELSNNGIYFSAICIQETWLPENYDYELFKIPGYQTITQGYSCGKKGGLITYLQDHFTYSKRDLYIPSKHWEGLFIDVCHEDFTEKITIANVYRPPRDNYSNTSINNFLEPITPIITQLTRENSALHFCGDFNINLLEIEHREKYQEYFDLFLSNGLVPTITLPTRFSKKKATLIDQIFSKSSNCISTSTSGIFITKLSDHLPCFTIVNINKPKKINPKLVKLRINTPEANVNFIQDIKSSVENTNFSNDLLQDPNISYNKLEDIIRKSKDKNLPTKLVKFNKYRHKISPWITGGILKSIKLRDKMYKKLKKTNPSSINYPALEVNFKEYCRLLQKSIRLAKSMYYTNQFEKYKSDIRKTWNQINQVIGKNCRESKFPLYFWDKNIKETDNKRIAELFNEFFTEVGPRLCQKIKTPEGKSFKQFLTEHISTSFNFDTVDSNHVAKIIKKLKPTSSFGHDDISTIMLKLIAPDILPILTLIINQSLCTGIFPDQLKIAKIKPIFKKDEPHLTDNYRPISLLPSISKVFEKVVFLQLYSYFNINNLLYDSQYGFRHLHSTEFSALEVTDSIYQNLDNKKSPLAVYLDLSKAFDTIDHSILLHKLSYYGVKGTALNWFTSYLTNRQQYVQFNSEASSLKSISTGVPQGSILGPLLFIIYMNDIAKVTNKFHFTLYADDTSLIEPLCTFTVDIGDRNTLSDQINSELQKIFDWLSLNKLSLNVKKTKMMVFHNRQRNIKNMIPKLTIDGIPIEYVRNFNFLGIVLDEHMTWNPHTNKVACTIARTIGTLKRLKRFLPQSILKTLYNSLILPHLSYGILTWGTKSSRLVKLQKYAVRTITNSKYNAHTEPIFKKLKLLKIQDLYKSSALKFYFKYKNDMVPSYFKEMFTVPYHSHNYGTRNRDQARLQQSKTALTETSLRFYIPRLILSIPNNILDKINTHSLHGFSTYVKRYLIDLYQSQCFLQNCYICNLGD